MQILFYPHTSKANKKGLAPLKVRITLGPDDKAEKSTGKSVDPKLWDADKKRLSGRSASSDAINKYIVWAENKFNDIETDLQRSEKDISSEIILNIFFGKHIDKLGIIKVIDMHNNSFAAKVEAKTKGHNQSTLQKYFQLKEKLIYFLKTYRHRDDMFMGELDFNFIEDFWEFLITKGKRTKEGVYAEPLGEETAHGVIGRLKKVARLGFRKQGIAINPFDDFKVTFERKQKEPLTIEQINVIMHRKFASKRLDRVRDRFIVGCFTGLADSDIQKASPDMITVDINGDKWLDIHRTKTDGLSMIPLWKPVLDIIEKYKSDPELANKNRLFPQISNQKMNEYLIDVAELCDIPRDITTHIARHSYGNNYLNSGGTLEGLAKILGHTTTTSTRIYARRSKISIGIEADQVRKSIFGYIDKIEPVKKNIG